jgi:hypothetical protein
MGGMALSASQMVTLIDETIAERLGGPKRFQDGPDQLEHYDLRELKELRREYADIAAQEETDGGCETLYASGSPFDGQ